MRRSRREFRSEPGTSDDRCRRLPSWIDRRWTSSRRTDHIRPPCCSPRSSASRP